MDTTWQEVFDSSSVSVQNCIRDSLNASLFAALEQPVTEDFWAEDLYPCLDPATSSEIFLITAVANIEEDGWEVRRAEQTCLQDPVAEIDVVAILDSDEESEERAEFWEHVISCVPDYFVSAMVAEVGLRLEDLSREEVSCLRVLLNEPGTVSAMSAPEDSAEFAGIAGQMMACIPDVFVSEMLGEFGLRLGDLSREEASCLRSLVNEPDIFLAMSAPDDSPEFAKVMGRMMGCIPDIFIYQMLGEMGLRLEDLKKSEASCLRLLVKEPEIFLAASAPENSPEFVRGMVRMIACIPDVFIALMLGEGGLSIEDLSEEEASCMRNLLTKEDLSAGLFAPESSPEYAYFIERLASCVPAVFYGQS